MVSARHIRTPPAPVPVLGISGMDSAGVAEMSQGYTGATKLMMDYAQLAIKAHKGWNSPDDSVAEMDE